jgi:hypothetical protein
MNYFMGHMLVSDSSGDKYFATLPVSKTWENIARDNNVNIQATFNCSNNTLK